MEEEAYMSPEAKFLETMDASKYEYGEWLIILGNKVLAHDRDLEKAFNSLSDAEREQTPLVWNHFDPSITIIPTIFN